MTATRTIATWNINGIRARLPRVLDWLRASQVDILCLQEVKTTDDKFPHDAFAEAGYHIVTHGQKTYNGVAIASRLEIHEVEAGLPGNDPEPQARLIAATVDDVRVLSAYFPNGKEVGSDKYAYKLRWMAALKEHLAGEMGPRPRLALCGDFNVAPEARDTHDPERWEGNILCSDKEREALAAIRALGLHDAFRKVRPDEVAFTWWDYRALAFPKNHGLRIDHVYVTAPLVERVTSVEVDREARKGKQPSDHAPLIVGLDI